MGIFSLDYPQRSEVQKRKLGWRMKVPLDETGPVRREEMRERRRGPQDRVLRDDWCFEDLTAVQTIQPSDILIGPDNSTGPSRLIYFWLYYHGMKKGFVVEQSAILGQESLFCNYLYDKNNKVISFINLNLFICEHYNN